MKRMYTNKRAYTRSLRSIPCRPRITFIYKIRPRRGVMLNSRKTNIFKRWNAKDGWEKDSIGAYKMPKIRWQQLWINQCSHCHDCVARLHCLETCRPTKQTEVQKKSLKNWYHHARPEGLFDFCSWEKQNTVCCINDQKWKSSIDLKQPKA